MPHKTITDGIFWVGSIDWNRKLFEDLTPLHEGTSYNSYLIKGSKKTVLIDTVDPNMTHELIAKLEALEVDRLDYIVTNHAEQDHSGSLPAMLELFPEARVLCSRKCKPMLLDLLELDPKRIDVVEDRDTLDLGDRTLEFIYAPWVHWPETMLTWCPEEGILFSCDMFGSHVSTNNLFVQDVHRIVEGAKLYYAEVMMPFGKNIQRHLTMLEDLEIKMIAPSHGPIWNGPETILECYREWSSDKVANKVVLAWVSTHGSTERMANHLMERLVEKGVTVEPFHLAEMDLGQLAIAMIDAQTLVIGCSNVLAGPHPTAIYAACLVNALRPRMKNYALFGSYGWGGNFAQQIEGVLTSVRAEAFEPVLVKGTPREEAYAGLDRLASEIAEKHLKHAASVE